MGTKEKSKFASGTAGNNLAAGTDVAVISDVGKGTWEVSGTVRHSLIDGCRLAVGPVAGPTPLFTIPNGVNASQDFGPVFIEILSSTDDIVIELATATGAADTASAVIYAQRRDSL